MKEESEYLRESTAIEKEVAKEIGGAPISAAEGGRICVRGYRLLERQSHCSKRVRQAIVRSAHHFSLFSLSLSLALDWTLSL